jgi:HKD family nuclease
MAEFLTTRGTSYNIETIIMEAKMHLIFVTPFLQISKTLFERLKDASKRGVVIKIVYGKDELKPNERNSLAEIKNVQLYYHENLHAKCYFNEKKMVITSMNMYQFSENTNREMGILIDAVKEAELFKNAEKESLSIIEHSEIIPLKKIDRSYSNGNSSKVSENKSSISVKAPKQGYCIRCETRIPFDPSKPFCKDCYSSWAVYQNPTYKENVCHCCGEYTDETINLKEPLCINCENKFI